MRWMLLIDVLAVVLSTTMAFGQWATITGDDEGALPVYAAIEVT